MTDRNRKPIHSSAAAAGYRPAVIALAVAAAVATMPAHGEPMLTAALNRNADMSRWTDNYVELGAGWNSDDSFKFGEFSGLSTRGPFAIAGFNWKWTDRDDDARYLHTYAANLGLDSRKFSLGGGQYGLWGVSFSADRLTRAEVDSARFIHRGLGSASLTLPSGFAGISAGNSQPSDPDNAAAINAALHSFDVDQQRDIYRLGTSLSLGKNWDFRIDYRTDVRDGSRLTGAVFATNAGNPRSLVMPYPIDDRTTQIDVLLSYATQFAQMQVGYSYSHYENDVDALSWESPYERVSNWPAAPNGATVGTLGTLSLMPSNDAHQLTASGGLNLSRTTRLTAQLSYSVARQNEAFLPYTSNAAVDAPDAPPRDSLDGKVVNKLADIGLTARPFERLNLKFGYQYRDSDNRTPIAQYRYVIADTANQPDVDANSAAIRTNRPVSSSERKYVVDADYRLTDRTHLRGVFERRELDYTHADVSSADENKGSLELRRSISSEITGSVGISRKERRGSTYDKTQWFRNSYSTGSAAFAAATPFTNNPQMRAFLYADYDEDRVRTAGNWVPSETISVQGSMDWYERSYRDMNCTDPQVADNPDLTWADDCLGRKSNDGFVANVDLQWQPDELLTAFGYYTYMESTFDQVGRSFSGGGGLLATADDPDRDFNVNSKFRDHTIGVGVKYLPRERWELGAQYMFSRSRGNTQISVGPALAGATLAAVPDTTSTLHGLQLFAKWAYNRRTTIRFNYVYENLHSFDWAYANALPTATNNVLLTGQDSPRYVSHAIGCSVAVTMW